ncbi:YdbL family protein [Magnetovibrio blakemorei]|uniref:DUF1318 domain-containing protein n=1 Tax=Magnetovibrio blakemorei TaxID=28181 RepID=A0A1E5Q381_9PROT|nr:YdbL family protein [Magnetovibrio blakemorei]OEJ63797.1 hypothetical protein BEN30_17320 [Magnetovibrio blakemorei]
MQGDKRTLSRRFVLVATLALMVSALTGMPALAQSLQDLRASGAVGEAFDGYARIRSGAGADQSLVDATNAQRRAIYQKRAQEQGISVDQVGRVYAKAIFDKAPAGDWFLLESGKWVQK